MQRTGRIQHIVTVWFFGLCLTASSAASTPVEKERYREYDSVGFFALHLGGGWRGYIGVFQHYWEPYPFMCGACDLPTGYPHVFFRISADAGQIISRESSATRFFTLHESFAGIAELYWIGPVRFRAGFGVSSATFFFSPNFKLNEKIFNTSESEFGLVSSFEAAYRFKKTEIISPCAFDYIFSLPYPLLVVSFGLQIRRMF